MRVRVDVAKATVLIGTALNREPLSRRHKLAFTRSVTLKPNVAFALLQLAGLCDRADSVGAAAGDAEHAAAEGERAAVRKVLDPCCGSGTIALEAAQALRIDAVGVDKSLAVVRGAVANAVAGGLDGSCEFRQGNARSLHTLFAAHSFDAVVSNLPWGVQTGKASGDVPLLRKIYRVSHHQTSRASDGVAAETHRRVASVRRAGRAAPVSYTHLTLPTILLV